MKFFTSLLAVGIATLCGVSAAFSQTNLVTYQQTSTTGLTTNTITQPTELEDIQLAATTTLFPQQLTAITFGYGVLPNTAAQTAAVYFDFYRSIDTTSTGSVLGTYFGSVGVTLNIAANTSTTATALRSSSVSNLQTLNTPINFTSGSFGVVITFTDSTGQFYSTVLTPLTSSPGAPTVGTSTTGVYRDTNGDGVFTQSEFMPTLGNAFLQLTTRPVPEPSTWALGALGAAGMMVVVLRRRRADA